MKVLILFSPKDSDQFKIVFSKNFQPRKDYVIFFLRSIYQFKFLQHFL